MRFVVLDYPRAEPCMERLLLELSRGSAFRVWILAALDLLLFAFDAHRFRAQAIPRQMVARLKEQRWRHLAIRDLALRTPARIPARAEGHAAG